MAFNTRIEVRPTKTGVKVRAYTPKKVGRKLYYRSELPASTGIQEIVNNAIKAGAPVGRRAADRE